MHETYKPLLFPTGGFAQPYCYRCPLSLEHPACDLACADTLTDVLEREGDRVGAVIVEPLVQGAAGIITAPDGHLARVAAHTRAHGALLIVDEVATGFGRTGTMFASEQDGVAPDLMAVGKGLTGGYLPMSATLATEEVFSAFLGDGRTFFHGHSYSGNPLTAAVALANLDLFEAEETAAGAPRSVRRSRSSSPASPCCPTSATSAAAGSWRRSSWWRTRPPGHRSRRAAGGRRGVPGARELGLVIRPLDDVIVIMPALTMSAEELRFLR
jgi:adenosylmethionine---8-amino-7-oxononanoate aminotransferase